MALYTAKRTLKLALNLLLALLIVFAILEPSRAQMVMRSLSCIH